MSLMPSLLWLTNHSCISLIYAAYKAVMSICDWRAHLVNLCRDTSVWSYCAILTYLGKLTVTLSLHTIYLY